MISDWLHLAEHTDHDLVVEHVTASMLLRVCHEEQEDTVMSASKASWHRHDLVFTPCKMYLQSG